MRFCKTLCLFLALLITLTLSLTAFAEDSQPTEDDSSTVQDSLPEEESTAPDDSSTGGGTVGSGYAIKYGYKPLVDPSGNKASRYIKGPTPATAYVKGGDNYTVAANSYTFRDYVFAGWSDGSKVYQPGDIIYNVRGSITLTATWTRPGRPLMEVIGMVSYLDGDTVVEAFGLPVGDTVEMREGIWQDGEGRIFNGGSFLLSFSNIEFKAYSGGGDTYSVKYNGAKGSQCGFEIATGGSFTVDGCYEERAGYSFIGWQDGGGKVYLPGDTCTPTADTVFTARWQESSKPAPNYCSVTIKVGEGGTANPTGKTTVVKGEKITVEVKNENGYLLDSVKCDGEELGNNGTYTLTVNADMAFDISFKYVGGDTTSEESKEESEPTEESTEPGEDSKEESKSHTQKPSKTEKEESKLPLVFAIFLCTVLIIVAASFITKAIKNR